MSLSTHVGVAVVLPCAVGVFMCSVACSSGDQWPQSAFLSYCTSAADLCDISYPTPAALPLCFPGRQNCNRAALHTALCCELCCSHARTSDYITLCSCALFSNIVLMSRIWCCRTVTAHSPRTPNSPYVCRRLSPCYLRNVGVSFNKPEADGTVIGHSLWTSKLIHQPLVSNKFNIQFYGSVINLRA